MKIEKLSHKIIGMAMDIHSHFGPGFLEEVYKNNSFNIGFCFSFTTHLRHRIHNRYNPEQQ